MDDTRPATPSLTSGHPDSQTVADMRAFAIAALCVAPPLAAQAPDTASFITLQGKDTVAIEQYVQTGRLITGAWIQNQGGVFVHDYTLVLRADGWTAQYVMSLYTPRPPHTFLISVTYGADSATRIMVRDSVATTNRVVTQQSYPLAALSTLGLELALARARRAGTDSSTIILDRTEARGPSPSLPVRFFGFDSVRVGAMLAGRVDRHGRLLALRDGPRETRRVPSLDVAKLVAEFIRADSVARAARIAIDLPPAVLQRFVGEYSLTPAAVAVVELAGAGLTIRVGKQPPRQLLAASPTKFFLESTAAVTFEFEVDATGTVTGLTLVQGSVRQRAAKIK